METTLCIAAIFLGLLKPPKHSSKIYDELMTNLFCNKKISILLAASFRKENQANFMRINYILGSITIAQFIITSSSFNWLTRSS